MKAEIISVGTELLLGDIVNTNAAFISRELAAAGISCYYQAVVGDNPERLRQTLASSLSRADVVITTGGLGPTYDDLTKETVASHFGLSLKMHEPSLAKLKEYMQCHGRVMTPNNEKQAMMPEGAEVFINQNGTAPGLAVEKGGKTVVMLPGPPREMQPMLINQALPFLRRGSGEMLVSSSINIFGMGESMVETRLRDIMIAAENPTVAPYAKEGEVLLRVTACAKSEQAAKELIAPVVEKIKAEIGEVIYGIDAMSLEKALVDELLAKNLTIALAESCTGGYVAKRITDISGSSGVFGCGVVAYSNETKTRVLGVSAQTLEAYGAVSPETAREMADGARRLAGADIGLSVTGIAGPDGGTEQKPVGLVYIAVSTADGCEATEHKLARGYSVQRDFIRNLAASNALSLALKAARMLSNS